MKPLPREDGFYWVLSDKWIIAEYYKGDWHIIGLKSPLSDLAFDEIDERRLERPA